jgi:hypothetical protein
MQTFSQADQYQEVQIMTGRPSADKFVDGDEPLPKRPSATIEIGRCHIRDQ